MSPEELLVTLALLLPGLLAAGHALLNKRDPKAALGWIAVSLTFPVFGALAYFVFGVNRIHTRARKLHRRFTEGASAVAGHSGDGAASHHSEDAEDAEDTPNVPAEFRELARISDAVTRRPLTGGNTMESLHCGEEAYPPMLRAIREATDSIYLSTFIFDTDHAGREFLYALAEAAERGVRVRVLIDGIGAIYSWPRAATELERLGVKAARFLPPRLLPPAFHINLRNHRKILAVDGRVAFTGGMNLGGRHLAEEADDPSLDMHFRLSGPVTRQLEMIFREDWWFATGEALPTGDAGDAGDSGSEAPAEAGALCRTVVDGPNEDLNKLIAILVGAVSSARRRIEIMNPYFLPPRELTAALQAAALRGVEVNVVLPAANNLAYVHWAMRNMLWEPLERGVNVFYQPPPFVHTKLFVVDEHYVQIGSANLDPRSLRLNFEVAVEVYDRQFAQAVSGHFRETISRSRRVTLEELLDRPLWARLRDAAAWIFTPYL